MPRTKLVRKHMVAFRLTAAEKRLVAPLKQGSESLADCIRRVVLSFAESAGRRSKDPSTPTEPRR